MTFSWKKGSRVWHLFLGLNHAVFGTTHKHLFSLVVSLIKLASNHEWEVKPSRNIGPVGDLIAVTDRRGLLPLHSIQSPSTQRRAHSAFGCGGSFHDGCCCMVGLVVVKL